MLDDLARVEGLGDGSRVGEVEREEAGKKQRVDDEVRRGELVGELRQRDDSIAALRGLLAEKKAKLSGEDVVPGTPQKVIDYGKMGLDVLKRLDRARDATIAAILKQMDRVDEDLKLLEGLDDDALDGLGDDVLDGLDEGVVKGNIAVEVAKKIEVGEATAEEVDAEKGSDSDTPDADNIK